MVIVIEKVIVCIYVYAIWPASSTSQNAVILIFYFLDKSPYKLFRQFWK